MIENLILPLVGERFRNDEKYRTGHISIVNPLPGRTVAGAHIPEMKALARSLACGEDAWAVIKGFEAEAAKGRTALTHEELMVWGMMINCIRTGDRMAMLGKFVPYIDNWAVCDHVCCGAKWFRKTADAWDILCGYFASDKEFEVRFATVMAMSHFLDGKYLPRIFFQFDRLDFSRIRSEYLGPAQVRAAGGAGKARSSGMGTAPGEAPYYARMSVAWCLATSLAKFPDDTRAYLRHSRLPEDVIRLYVRKARESFRTRNITPF